MEGFTVYNDQSSPKDTKAETVPGCPSVVGTFSALHLLRYNHLLAHPDLRAAYPLSLHPEWLLPPRDLCPPPLPYTPPPPFLHVDSTTAGSVYGVCSQKKRGEKRAIPEEQKDDRYFERRRRNNQAAKKSRDARRIREDQIAMRAMHLEHENAMMTAQILTLREEIQNLRQLLLKCNKHPQPA